MFILLIKYFLLLSGNRSFFIEFTRNCHGPSLEPAEFSSRPHTLFNIAFKTVLYSHVHSSPRLFLSLRLSTKFFKHFSSLACILHVPPISPLLITFGEW
jgi:hypothetical protein